MTFSHYSTLLFLYMYNVHVFLYRMDHLDDTDKPTAIEAETTEDFGNIFERGVAEHIKASDYVAADSEVSTGVLLSVQEIADLVRNGEREEEDEEEADDAVETVAVPSNMEAITALATLQSFFSAQELTGGRYSDVVNFLDKMNSVLSEFCLTKKRQKKITDFFVKE